MVDELLDFLIALTKYIIIGNNSSVASWQQFEYVVKLRFMRKLFKDISA